MKINHQDCMKLTNKIFDQKAVLVQMICVHSWGDLDNEMIGFVADLYKISGAKYIVLNGEEEYSTGGFGFDYWRKNLLKFEIPELSIHKVTPARQTREEAIGFMNFAKQNNIDRAIVVSVPVHIVRAFLTNVIQLKELSLNLDLYPLTIKGTDWEKKISMRGLLVSNNSEGETYRLGRFAGEWGRIMQYRQKFEEGNNDYSIASIKEGLEYINNLR